MTVSAAYGSWPSAISARQVASAAPAIDSPCTDGDDIYWLEARPEENGRSAVVRLSVDGKKTDVLPSPFSARSRVHEYGGTPYIIVAGMLYFCEQSDQRIYRINTWAADATAEAISPADQDLRFADFCYDQKHQRLICVAEHASKAHDEPRNFIAALSLAPPYALSELVSGADFYAYPRLSPDSDQLAWISWSHPNMPWHSTALHLATLDNEGLIKKIEQLGGSATADAGVDVIFQPQWSPDGDLYFVSDRNNWWNIYRHTEGDTASAICPRDAEFATPLWTLGMSTYGFFNNDKTDVAAHHNIAACYTKEGLWQLELIDTQTSTSKTLALPFTQLSSLFAKAGRLWFVGASPSQSGCLVEVNTQSGQHKIIHQFPALPRQANNYSLPQAITFASTYDEQAHGFYYPPCNTAYLSPINNEKPPLIVMCHGGPTGATSTGLNLKIQFWTSRGFAVLDVNYRGSTGYGREYRQSLNAYWGIKDVDDVVAGAKYLIAQGLVDAERIAIRGSSAGGYTVLAALAFTDMFKAGASYYGIGDLETLARDTHKFESRYLDHLVGPYPREKATYRDRSPIHHIDQLNCPVIFFQGMEDKVVPPQQAQAMVAALQAKGLKVEYMSFPDEGHGFRQAKNTEHALLAELQFYSDVFGFDLPPDQTS